MGLRLLLHPFAALWDCLGQFPQSAQCCAVGWMLTYNSPRGSLFIQGAQGTQNAWGRRAQGLQGAFGVGAAFGAILPCRVPELRADHSSCSEDK